MSYEGSYNGFTFGDGLRPGASVNSLTGWRRNVKDNGDIRLVLNLHAENPTQLDSLIDAALAAFTVSATPLPLTIGGRSKWVQVSDASPVTDPAWAGPERTTTITIVFTVKDDTLYDATATNAGHIASGSPVSTATFEAANAGHLVLNAPRAYNFAFTAATTWVNPRIRVDHSDSTFEQITLQGLTVTAGQTLTLGADRLPRVGSQIVSGRIRATTEKGGPGNAAPWFRLLASDGSDGANEVTVTGSSGTFYGDCNVRGTY